MWMYVTHNVDDGYWMSVAFFRIISMYEVRCAELNDYFKRFSVKTNL